MNTFSLIWSINNEKKFHKSAQISVTDKDTMPYGF